VSSVHQCACGFATDDRLWFESHQAQHVLNGQDAASRDHDVSGMTTAQLRRARRDLKITLSFARPGSVTTIPVMAQIRAIDQELAGRRGTDS
jgi:hypothetical protein